jgi:hypothetical protein
MINGERFGGCRFGPCVPGDTLTKVTGLPENLGEGDP